MIYRLYILKRQVEDILMSPLVLLGRLIARVYPLNESYQTFYFFPFYHIGGAEKVHAQIAKATASGKCIIYFTRKSNNDLFLQEFRDAGCTIRDISKRTDNKWIYFVNIIYRGIISGYINSQQEPPLVFNGQCNFGYKISPWIARRIPQVELIHSLCSFSYIRIPFLPFIRTTVMISTVRIREHIDLYRRYDIPAHFENRIRFIMNAIDLPPRVEADQPPRTTTVLYVGRSTPEKRVHLVAEAARRVKEKIPAIAFQFLGEVRDAIPPELHPFCHFWGNQSDAAVIADIYNRSVILLLVSDTEGFPMVVMEAMSRGLAVISTAVGEVPLHVKDGINGFLIQPFDDPAAVVERASEFVVRLHEDNKLLQAISGENRAYAHIHFGMPRFQNDYQALFAEMRINQER